MDKSKLVYTTYIRSTLEKVWAAITNPEFTHQYWGGCDNISSWKQGAKWEHLDRDGQKTRVVGEVVEVVPPTRLLLTWAEPSNPTEVSKVSFDLEALEDMVCLTVIHSELTIDSIMAKKVSGGWPRVLSSLKSYLETGIGLNVRAGKSSCSQ